MSHFIAQRLYLQNLIINNIFQFQNTHTMKKILICFIFVFLASSYSFSNILVRAAGTVGGEELELIVDGQVLTTWTLSDGFANYTYTGPSNGVFRLNYTNDEGDRDVQIDYLEVDGTRHEAEDQQINTGSYANEQCGGGEYTEMMYCSGYIEFNLINPSLDSDNDGTPDISDECPNDPNKISSGNCGCGNPEGNCPVDDYRTHIDWAIPGGNNGLAACKPKFVGNIMPSSWAGPVVRDDYLSLWNQVSPENAGKWGVVEGTRDNYRWGDLDEMYNFCQQNNMPFKHHVYIWGSQQPGWLSNLSASEQLEEVEEWYELFASRYPNTEILDVVNESLPGHAPDVAARDAMGGFNNGASVSYLANHPYLAKYGYGTGWDYIIYAFAKARDYFPDAILVLNDYNIINSTSNIDAHLEIVNILKERNLIDAVGIQSHCFSIDNMSSQQLKTNLDRLASADLPIHVTELDIRGDNNNESSQRNRYATLFPTFYEHPAVACITVWGYVEGTTWKDYTGILNANGSERAAMTWLKEYMAGVPCDVSVDVDISGPSKDTTIVIPGDISFTANVSDPDAITTLKFYVNGEQVGETEYVAPYFTTVTITEAGTYEFTTEVMLSDGTIINSDPVIVTANVPQSPYNGSAHPVPGVVQAEEFDLGGNGFAYYDDSKGSETTVSFRDDEDVDIEECTDNGAGFNLGYTTAGEWLEYTVDVQAAGTYDIDLRVATDGDDRTISLSFDEQIVASEVAIPNTGGWQAWETVTIEDVELSSGEQVMRLSIGDVDYVNINFVEVRGIVTGNNELVSHGLNVYPNPSKKEFEIKLIGEFEYEVIDLQGGVIVSGAAVDKAIIGRTLNTGTYVLKIIASKDVIRIKIIKN